MKLITRKRAARTVAFDELKVYGGAVKVIPARNEHRLALLIAAHNEELVLENTIRSAIAAGQKPEDIYVVDDNSTDPTSQIAKSIIPAENVIKVRRSGKGLALTKAGRYFRLAQRYDWIHIADADGAFAPDYFPVFRRQLNRQYAAATGYVRSLPGSTISQYRVYEYTIGMELTRRIQAAWDVIPIIPGPTSCFRSDVFRKVNFANKSLTEDFDVTLQIHRQNLGGIQFIPDAVAYTQDPRSFKDFYKQILRWNRGIMQGIARHKIGFRASKVDFYLTYQLWQNFMFFFNYFVLIPGLAFRLERPDMAATAFLSDVAVTWVMMMLSVARSRRADIVAAFPFMYFLRFVVLFAFLRAFLEVNVLRRYRHTEGFWSTAGRRYRAS